MKQRRVFAFLLVAIMSLSIVFTGCGSKQEEQPQTVGDAEQQEEQKDEEQATENTYEGLKEISYYVGDEPQTLDAQQMTGAPDMFLLNTFQEGLLRFGQTEGEYVPGVAKEYSFDEASNSYTFVLRDDALWADGTQVTADDFIFGWRLALEEQTPYSFMISDYIKGAAEYAAVTKKSFLMEKDADFKALVDQAAAETDEEAAKTLNSQISDRLTNMTDEEAAEYKQIKDDLWAQAGVTVDGNNMVIELANPAPYFPGLTAFCVFMPVNEKFYEEHKAAGDYSLEASGLNANGPWVVEEWAHDDYFTLVKNENYWNKDNIKIDQVNIKVVDNIETRTNLLKTGKLDGSAIQADDVPEFEDMATLDQYNLQPMVNMSDYTVFYLEFNHYNNPITQNVNIRKAMAYAMDRTSFVEKVNIGDEAALAGVPTYFPGLNKSFREENGVELFEDNQKEKAKELLAQGLQELGMDELPPLDMLIGTSDISNKIAEKFQADWAEIGITVNLVPVPWGEKLSRLKAGDFAICSSGWGPDYLDPMTYLDLFESTNGNNNGQYNNPEYDKLIRAAKAEKNAETRMELLYAADKMVIDDMIIAPQYFRIAHWTYKNYLTGVVNRGAGPATDFYWADVDMDAKLADQQ